MKVSVIVPVFNEEKEILNCLRSLNNTSYSNKEIIVVNDGSNDKTLNIIKKMQNIKLVSKKHGGLISAIKEGVFNSEGDIIIKIDGDSIVETFWIDKVVNIFKEEKVTLVGGMIKNSCDNSLISSCLDCIDCFYNKVLGRFLSVSKVMGANWAIKSEILKSNHLWKGITDERVLLDIIANEKIKAVIKKDIFVTINSPKKFTDLWRRKFLWGKRAVIDKFYLYLKYWIRPIYFILIILSISLHYTLVGRILALIVLLPIVLLFLYVLIKKPKYCLIAPLVLIYEELAFVCGGLCILLSKIKTKWK